AEVDTVLVLSGVTGKAEIPNFAYTPKYVLSGLDELTRLLV
ncbi:MAG: HAD hydrolase-like protein, partial [Lentisphaeria bacterium]|nr:HAD hydrolase-like protein [Lentisphaeria bacterium]